MSRPVRGAHVATEPAPPRRVRVMREGGDLEITVPKLSRSLDCVLSAFFCTLAGVFFLVQPLAWAISGRSSWGELQRLLPTMLAGVGCAYYALTCFINRATLRIDDGRLVVRHGPLPWFGNRELPLGGLHQLEAHRSRSRRTGIVSISLVALPADGGSRRTVLGGLTSVDEAHYLVRVLAPFVGGAAGAASER